jgi:SWI/SNF-related matrix-associated actin-dependent regulator 1 of chromatin subfamily A
MKPTYSKEKERLFLNFDYNPIIIDDIKSTLDYKERSWDPIAKQWQLKISILNQNKIKELLDRNNFIPQTREEKEEIVKTNLNTYLRTKSRLHLIKSYQKEVLGINSIIKPFPFQQIGIDTMCSWPYMINGDDMGLGKSVQAIFTAEITNNFPCLLICPSSTKYQWKELWHKINLTRSISIIDSKDKIHDFDTDVVIINYDMIGKKESLGEGEDGKINYQYTPKFKELIIIMWEYLILDEIHWIKNSKTTRNQIVKKIVNFTKPKSIHGLTGTLVENKPVEIANPLFIIGMFEEIFGNWNTFTGRYCDATETKYGRDVFGSSNTLELNKILRETCYIRREKRDVLPDLPEIQYSVLNIDITNRKEYKKAEDNFIEYIEENFSSGKLESAMLAEYLVQRNQLRLMSIAGKLKGIEAWLEDLKEQTNEKVLVVGNYTESLNYLSIKFDAELINGSMDAYQKREAINLWNKFKKKQFIFGNCRAIGTGTDGLQANCSTMVIIDLPDKPSTLDQTISRLERIGVKNAINIYYLLSNETIDTQLWDSIQAKKQITEAINKGKDVKPINFDDLLIKSYLKRL